MFSADLGGYTAPPPAATDPPFQKVALLLHGDGTNGAQNNTFVDSSSNNFTITRTGNVAQGTFSPFSLTEGQWSNYFDGTGDYLTAPSDAAYAYGTGDFTWEMWIYPTSSAWTSSNIYLLDHGSNGGTLVYQNGFKYYNNTIGTTSALYDPGAGSITPFQWTHIAISRSSGTSRMFVNGELKASGSDSHNYAAQIVNIGRYGGNSFFYTGYMSNIRLVKGTAVYTSNFTPSTTPLTAITNTSLLTCQSNRFKDNSSNNFTITRNGDTKVTAFSPFAPSAAYSAITNGGSGYFDGSGDYLNVSGGTGFDFGSGDFTIEFWFNSGSIASTQIIYDGRPAATNGAYPLVYLAASKLVYYVSTAARISGATTLSSNIWYHVAISRSGTSTNLFLNGVQEGSTYTDSTVYLGPANRPSIGTGGYDTTSPLSGYVSNVRVVKGTALYTGNFTPSTAPLTAVTNTQLLLNCTNAGIIDNAGKNDIETVGNAQISTSVKKYGTGSMYFDGTGDYLILRENPDLYAFGSGDFTIEMWVNFTAYPSSFGTLYDARPASTNGAYAALYADTTNLYYYVSTANRITVALSTFGTGTWKHLAVSRSGTSTKMFVDGVQVSSTYTDSTVYLNPTARPVIGAGGNSLGNYSFNGYIDDLRITKGQALYTSNFTPPTQAFPDV